MLRVSCERSDDLQAQMIKCGGAVGAEDPDVSDIAVVRYIRHEKGGGEVLARWCVSIPDIIISHH